MERDKSKMVMVVTIAAILGIGAYAFADWGGYGMMGGHGMMGGGSMGNFGQDSWNGSRPNMRNFNQNDLSDREGIETLRRKIDQKRKELATLYRSDDADKTQIDNKIDELSSLERSLDEKISSYGTGR
jgi:Spy/CpxP family protein refolding chaperone